MGEGMQAVLAPPGRCYESSVDQAIGAHETALFDPVLAGLETAVEMAEADPEGARAALWRLQGDWQTLERLEDLLGGPSTQTTFRIGAIIHLVRAELARPEPDPRRLIPEILNWLSR